MRDGGFWFPFRIPDTWSAYGSWAVSISPPPLRRRGMNPFKDLKLLLFYRRLMKRYRPEAVLTYTIKPNIYGGLAARMTKTPYLANITGLGTTLEHEGALQKMIVLLYRTALKKASCVFFQNKGNRDFMREKGCVTGKCRVIPGSGVNLAEHRAQAYPPENASGDGRQGGVSFHHAADEG